VTAGGWGGQSINNAKCCCGFYDTGKLRRSTGTSGRGLDWVKAHTKITVAQGVIWFRLYMLFGLFYVVGAVYGVWWGTEKGSEYFVNKFANMTNADKQEFFDDVRASRPSQLHL